ncbi:FAD-binding oxidoreductase [Pseudarthrobacter sp. AB1]|uniref:NAD(P)/FAD-dependent oxidoreductase n=1 Tax=Pseudarthrobacter sp. AB1 TaxID=2138309 RepID=UPI00186B71FD|nr:FAD-binding oxidoreductase [Pseudarthrobacter sp. AB1]MBE4720577.1 hypothetical protein [Pseudarthrobacter sp. AB1]
MTDVADVVVVGGGVFGVSLAHHLHDQGAKVRIVERDGIAQATSTCGAGFVAYWAGGWGAQAESADMVACERYGLDFYTELHEEFPVFPLRRNGSLYLATRDGGWDQGMKPIVESSLVPGRQILDRNEAVELGQIVRADAVVGGVFDPDPVQVDAHGAVLAAAQRLRSRGVAIDERRPATRLIVSEGRVRGVETPYGDILAETVVLAAGMWSNQLLAPHSVWLPYAPMGALRITTEPLAIPDTMPMLLIPDASHAWVREKNGGLLFGCAYNGQHRSALLDVDPPDRLREMPMDGLRETQRLGAQLASVLPPLGRYQDFTYTEGAPCFTPDLLPLIGEVPEISGVYVFGGDNESGITHAPALGRALAQMITGHEPFVPMEQFRPDRFNGQFTTAREVAHSVARSRGEGGVFQ